MIIQAKELINGYTVDWLFLFLQHKLKITHGKALQYLFSEK
uniref:Uncharacterized protein n=1 Tax=Myoviridae sp. ctXwe21 TaxID=2825123 RepID=A0A8S5PXN2_9CAUD|nr:MAG TPA: hypothetical protein [Myoviridae sp. ctXwe21]